MIATNQALDKEICAFNGYSEEDERKVPAERLNAWHASAEAAVMTHAPHRIGFYKSDAGLDIRAGMMGWREQYVTELRRRQLRLNDIQVQR